jgi:glutamate dehydrogenase
MTQQIHFKIYLIDNIKDVPKQEVNSIYHSILLNFGFSILSVEHQINYFEYSCLRSTNFLNEEKVNIELTVREIALGLFPNDVLNKLLLIGLSLKDINIIRSFLKITSWHSAEKNWNTLLESFLEEENTKTHRNSMLDHFLTLFKQRFNPEEDENDFRIEEHPLKEVIIKAQQYQLLDHYLRKEKNILKHLYRLLASTVRTNYFQVIRDDCPLSSLKKQYQPLVLKLMNQTPCFIETFVFSTQFEGVHIRFSKFARGGIRIVGNEDDLYYQCLDLARTQSLKNLVCTIEGAKGCFRKLDQSLLSYVECYQLYIDSLLSITDNLSSNFLPLHHLNIKALDQDDYYLVVAADKGTANFSDLANEISSFYHYWLHNCFASGSSHGYNHKEIGITSLGALNNLAAHRSLNKYKTIGVGSMKGDVFGNAVLGENIELIAAISGESIFIDPHPTSEAYLERRRLFALSLGWDAYQIKEEYISSHGIVLKRKENNYLLSNYLQSFFHLNSPYLSDEELVYAIFQLKVDLCFMGGIGTYGVGIDEKKNSYMMTGKLFGAEIIVEGANLSFTQLGRIEFTKKGGKINTDFFDNSAAVMCSDYEVNLSLGLDIIGRERKIDDLEKYKKPVVERIINRMSQYNIILNSTIKNIQSKQIKKEYQNIFSSAFRPQVILERYFWGKEYKKKLLEKLDSIKIDLLSQYFYQYFPSQFLDDMNSEEQKQLLCHPMFSLIAIHQIYDSFFSYFSFSVVEDLESFEKELYQKK